ncbi:hypothetical protein GOP47_0013312 [Adiantum capillus-veneris]|uniref:Uncharacterized protein n=1 Tax=Adiantum capillus-veneris TaxID=13818 RepID=A0A9D4UNG5_ADICA|nr:hypothetical protein GOP47_0013312 [Adiantum capillus-veneris]
MEETAFVSRAEDDLSEDALSSSFTSRPFCLADEVELRHICVSLKLAGTLPLHGSRASMVGPCSSQKKPKGLSPFGLSKFRCGLWGP